eukprot:8651219-Lingulodinium_polyedra.AAC.1
MAVPAGTSMSPAQLCCEQRFPAGPGTPSAPSATPLAKPTNGERPPEPANARAATSSMSGL